MMDLISILDLTTSITGVLGTTILCFFPARRVVRFTAFGIYVVANISLGLLAYLKGIPVTAGREVIYLVLSLVGMYRDRPRNDK